MKAIISTTYDAQYFFFVPLVTWAWNALDVDVICFIPNNDSSAKSQKLLNFMRNYLQRQGNNLFVIYGASPEKEATYAQCARLYAAGLPLFQHDETLITSDVDMAVFNKGFFETLKDGKIHVVGTDLVPDSQYPMCYISMPVTKWRKVMMIDSNVSPQTKLDQLLGHLECEHFRGNYWAKDQEEAYNYIHLYELVKHNRAAPGTQFATRRADRDGWPEVIPPDIIDAHLPRPGYTEENFNKIINLFQSMYPLEDFTWMREYRDEYIKLI